MERVKEKVKKEDEGTKGQIVFGCSEGDWQNITSLSAEFEPGSHEDSVLSANVEALFRRHNDKAHSGNATLKVKSVTEPIPPKKS